MIKAYVFSIRDAQIEERILKELEESKTKLKIRIDESF
jgi:hypothetical protein